MKAISHERKETLALTPTSSQMQRPLYSKANLDPNPMPSDSNSVQSRPKHLGVRNKSPLHQRPPSSNARGNPLKRMLGLETLALTPTSSQKQRPPYEKENLDPNRMPSDPNSGQFRWKPLGLRSKSPLHSRSPSSNHGGNPLKRILSLETLSEGGSPTSIPSDSGVQVKVRMRSLINKEEDESDQIAQKLSPISVSVADTRSTQQDTFELVGLPLVENCLSGFNGSKFANGQANYPLVGSITKEPSGPLRRPCMQDIEALAQHMGIDLAEVNLDAIILPPGEDFGIESDDDDLFQEDQLEFEGGFRNIIVLDNLPVVPPEKFEKLVNVIRQIYYRLRVVTVVELSIPVNPETQKTLGYCFIECNSPEEAEVAREKTNGYKLDKSHIFEVNLFDDFEKFMNVPDEWTPAEIKPYTPGENLQQWLTDEKARDQFVIRAGMHTEVYWNDPRHHLPELVYRRSYWTESFVQWSPLGTYLATVHSQGAAMYGGATTFNRLMRYAHPQVKLIDFSPGEIYLVTYSSHEPSNPCDTRRVVLNIFDVRTGKLMRDFKGNANEFTIGGSGAVTGVSWPVFRWGGGKEDKYFARIGKNVISVYETETFTLIDKKSLKVENVLDFTWSPADPILALFVPELGGGNRPARISLVQIPGKEELRQKNLLSVSDCKMYWQSNGEYLAVKVDRYTKTKKSIYTGFELFCIKERGIPIEVLDLNNKNDKIIAFAWEPNGHRFAVIHGDNPHPDISFYTMRTAQNVGRVQKLTTLKSKQANALYWSPAGRFIVLAGLKGLNGQLVFYNVDELETMAAGEHFMATDIEWDPTGRYVATSVTSVHEMENGFHIWSFNGKLLYSVPKDHFYQFLWRPRPPSFLTAEKEEEIAKNLKKYSKKYEAEDQDVVLQLSEQDRKRRKMLQEEWEEWVANWKKLHEEERELWIQLRDGEASDAEEEYEAKEVEVEEVLEVQEVIQQDFE